MVQPGPLPQLPQFQLCDLFFSAIKNCSWGEKNLILIETFFFLKALFTKTYQHRGTLQKCHGNTFFFCTFTFGYVRVT